MTLWKTLLLVVVAASSVACGPEIQFDAGEAAPDVEFDLAPQPAEALSAPALPAAPLDVVSAVQGRGEFSADLFDAATGDLSAVIHAAEPMLVVELDVDQGMGAHDEAANPAASVAAFDDVTLAGGSVRVLRRRLSESELLRYAEVPGREFWLYDAQGYVCTAAMADLWQVREEWAEPEQEDEGYSPGAEAERELVAASILPTEGDCTGALHATPASGVAAFFTEVATLDRALSARALAEFERLPEYLETQKEYVSEEWLPDDGGATRAGRGKWTEYTDSGSSVTQFSDGAGRKLVRIAAWAGVGCGDFRGDLWAVWESTSRGLVLRALSRAGESAGFFLERDGRLSFGSESRLHAAFGNHWQQSYVVLEPWSCPC